jgi:hypothetical protein
MFSKWRLFWAYFKSTLGANLFFSFIVAVTTMNIIVFPVCIMSGGPLFAFFYKQVARSDEYYFYGNRGISKYQLMAFTMAVTILLGGSALIFLLYVAYS